MAELRAQEIVTNRDVVSELILKSFLACGVAEQRLIVQQNRLQPKLDIQRHGRAFFVKSGMRDRLVVWN